MKTEIFLKNGDSFIIYTDADHNGYHTHLDLEGSVPFWAQYLDFYRKVWNGRVLYKNVPVFLIQYIVNMSGGTLSGHLPLMKDFINEENLDLNACNLAILKEVENYFPSILDEFKYCYFTNFHRFLIKLHTFTWRKDVFCHKEGIYNTEGAFSGL